jgi:PAS domain S-box-containing protein
VPEPPAACPRRCRRTAPDERRSLAILAQRCALALERARLYDELQRTTERYQLATEAASIAVWEWDLRTGAVLWSGSGRALFGYDRGESVADLAWWDERLHPDDRDRLWAAYNAASASGADGLSQECRVRRADGTYARCELVARYLRDGTGALVRALGVVVDVTRTREAEEERDRLAEALARADERGRLAMDLHDELVQQLYGAALTVRAAKRAAADDPAAAPAALARAAATIEATIGSVRAHVRSLRATAAPAGGLRAGLHALVAEFRGGEPPRIDVDVTGEVDQALPPDAVAELLLVAREAVSNAVRHGRASTVTLRATRSGRRFVLKVCDDGVGFDPAAASRSGGCGLRNMVARAERLGGALSVRSAPGRGTEVLLDVPLPGAREPADRRRPAARPAQAARGIPRRLPVESDRIVAELDPDGS